MGTPHRGSSLATWGNVLASIAKGMFLKPPKKLLEALQSNSEELSGISEEFIKLISRYGIKSFYEEAKMGGVAIVGLHSVPNL
jgi:hypothetical protein